MKDSCADSFGRRQLLRGGAALSLLQNGLKGAQRNGQPLFRFIQWNDQHVDATQPEAYAKANRKQEYLAGMVKQLPADRRPAFILNSGDLIQGEDLPSIRADLQVFRRLTADLGMPFYPLVGNHEVKQQETDPQWLRPYVDEYGPGRVDYTFEHGGILFVAFNNSGAPVSNASNSRNKWVRDVLKANKGTPKILCCHIPLVPIRDDAVLRESFGFVSYAARDWYLQELVRGDADTVIAVLAGHLHLTGMVKRNGIYHIVPSGTASYPCDYAEYEVYPDRIAVRMIQIPAHLRTRETDLHGRPRYTFDYTDRDHPTHELYVKGNPAERSFEIPLEGRKRLL